MTVRLRPMVSAALAGLLLLTACTSTATTPPTATPIRLGPPATSAASPASSTPAPAAVSPPPNLTPATVTRVVDGDTIVVSINGQEQKVRYTGVNTPETVDPRRPVQCYGHEASDRNHQLVNGQTVGLEKDVSETDDFGRLLRYVWLGDRMINAQLVAEGYAQATTYPPDVRYQALFAQLETAARTAGRGLWGPACNTSTPAPPAGGCDYSGTSQPLIKGNISSSGEKIYHVPGGAFYDQTTIDESAGERWFCTEAEAQAAGWRKSSR
jgi:micrococcal nuclease